MSCEQCTQGYILPGEPAGSIVDGAYLAQAPEDAASSGPKRAIVYLTDIFGLPLKNSKIIADELSKRVGCDVWIPDLFAGSPPVTVDELEPLLPSQPGQKVPWTAKLGLIWLLLTRGWKLFGIRASVVDPRVVAFATKLRKEKGYEKIGAVGYCFGGSVAIRLGSTDLFDSLVVAHPGNCTIEQIKAMKKPTSWACAEEDMSFKKPLRDEAEAVFAARKDKPDFVEYEFKDYKGTCHGFAARPDLSIPAVVEAYKGALDQTAAWFQKTLQS